MRANEFILVEDFGDDGHSFNLTNPAMPRSRYFPDLDKYYALYRLALDMAGINTPEDQKINDIDGEGWPAGNNAIMLAYTDVDDQIIDKTLKKRGLKQKRTSDDKSEEMNFINKVSPVAAKKKNRFGV